MSIHMHICHPIKISNKATDESRSEIQLSNDPRTHNGFQETKPSNQENKNVKPSKMYLHITSIPTSTTSTTLTTSTTSISSSLVNIHTSPNLQPQVYAQYGLCPGHGSARKSWRSEDMRPPRWAKRRSPPSPDAWPTINVRLRFLTNQVDRCCPY